MLRINRTFLLVYDSLIAFAFMLRYILIGPVLFNSIWCFWLTLVVVTVVLIGLSYLTFCHPTPLEIVAYHVNLIMRHRVDENNDEDYNEKNKTYLSNRFIQSANYQFFYYGNCCAKTDQYRQMKIKLALGQQTFNQISIIIKTVDEQYIRFNLIKQTESPLIAFLYHWEVDQIEYSDKETFDQMVKGLI